MSERITSEQVQSDVESYALRASPDGRRRVIREALDKARREGGEDAQAEVARLKAQVRYVCEAAADTAERMAAEADQLRAALAASEARAAKAAEACEALESLVDYSSRMFHDSTMWESEEETAPRWQAWRNWAYDAIKAAKGAGR